jgi:hypothetical protein
MARIGVFKVLGRAMQHITQTLQERRRIGALLVWRLGRLFA